MTKDILELGQQLGEAKSVAQDVLAAKHAVAEAAATKVAAGDVIVGHHSLTANQQEIVDAKAAGISAKEFKKYHPMGHGLVGIGAGAAMVGASGVGAGQGIAAGRAAEAVGRNPEAESKIRTIFILGVGIAESAAIYALIVSILLLFVF